MGCCSLSFHTRGDDDQENGKCICIFTSCLLSSIAFYQLQVHALELGGQILVLHVECHLVLVGTDRTEPAIICPGVHFLAFGCDINNSHCQIRHLTVGRTIDDNISAVLVELLEDQEKKRTYC